LPLAVIMVAWWTSRSMRAAATIASPRISPHCSKPRLEVTAIEPAFVAAGDEREQEVGGLALEGKVADLVDDEQVVALEAPQLLLELVAVLCGLEARDPLLGGREGDAVVVLARLERPHGLDEQQDVFAFRRVG
jgi:hypothetical protein